MDEQFEEGVVTEGMGALNIRTTDGVAGFSDNDWEAWDALLNESGEASVHLESRAGGAEESSPHGAGSLVGASRPGSLWYRNHGG